MTITTKSSLRTAMRERLQTVSPEQLRNASHTICKFLSQQIDVTIPAPIIATYAAHGQEINLLPLHKLLPTVRFLYPLCHPHGIISFHEVTSPNTMKPGMLGILEPLPHVHPLIPIQEIDHFLCPGLAFGSDGSRLGHGGGYYDRALAKKSESARLTGISLEMQLVENIPTSPHDIYLDGIVTECGYRDVITKPQ